MRLCDVKVGQKVTIQNIDLDYNSKIRLNELGFSNKSMVTLMYKSMTKSLYAYKVKNTIIALRDKAAQNIYVVNPDGGRYE